MAIRCPKCKRVLKKGDVFCPKCGENLTKYDKLPVVNWKLGCGVIFLMFFIFSIVIGVVSGETDKKNFIIDAEQFSLISSSELKNIMGKEKSSDNWTNKAATGNYKVTTKTYEKDGIYYEFILADKKVVRTSIYSSGYWTGKGDRFNYSSISKIPEQFNIKSTAKALVQTDNGFTYRLRNVSEKIEDFNVQDITKNDKTFGFVKVTYDMTYFE